MKDILLPAEARPAGYYVEPVVKPFQVRGEGHIISSGVAHRRREPPFFLPSGEVIAGAIGGVKY